MLEVTYKINILIERKLKTMKKNSLKKAFAAMALTAVAATAATSAFSASAVEAKPVLKLSQIELKWEDLDTDGDGKIDANKTQTIELCFRCSEPLAGMRSSHGK